MYIVHARPALPFPAAPRTHAQKTCHNPLMMGGNPSGGTIPIASGGTILDTELIVGITTPGCVRKTTRNVPAYPKPIVFCVETTYNQNYKAI